MPNQSTFQNRSDYEKARMRLRFEGWQGQTQGTPHSLPNFWVPQARGTYAFPSHQKDNEEAQDNI